MFDPTVFDNLKVAFENEIYDLDNLDGRIVIADRKDTLELAVMAREFRLRFYLAGQPEVHAEVCLRASLKDLAAELLEQPGAVPGCSLSIYFYTAITDEEQQCGAIQSLLASIWEPAALPQQTLSRAYSQQDTMLSNVVELPFTRQINEEQMNDIPELVEHMLQSLEQLADTVVKKL